MTHTTETCQKLTPENRHRF